MTDASESDGSGRRLTAMLLLPSWTAGLGAWAGPSASPVR